MRVLDTVPQPRAYTRARARACVCVCVCTYIFLSAGYMYVNPEAVNVSLTTLSKPFNPHDYLSSPCRPAACITIHLPLSFL